MRMTGLWWIALLGLMLVPGAYAQREPGPAPGLTELTKAARAEGELNLVAGGGVWGEAEFRKILAEG